MILPAEMLGAPPKHAIMAAKLETLRAGIAMLFGPDWPEVVNDSREVLAMMRKQHGVDLNLSAYAREYPKGPQCDADKVLLACAVQLDLDEKGGGE